MTRCRPCGFEYADDESFCPSCGVGRGERLPDLSPRAPARSSGDSAEPQPGEPPDEESPSAAQLPGERERQRALRRGATVGGGVAALVVVVMVVVGLVSGAIAFHPSGRSPQTLAGDTASRTSRPAASPTPITSPGGSPGFAGGSPPPAGKRVGAVQVVPALTHGSQAAQVTEVARLFDRYFAGINHRSYGDFVATLVPRPGGSLDQWRNLQTSHDSDIELFDVAPASNGSGPTASVAFTSRQRGDRGPVPGETCTNWLISYNLRQNPDGSLLIDLVVPPAVTHTACQR